MKTQTLEQAIHVIGIELRTTNLEAMQSIPPHWARFTQEGVLARVPGKTSEDVFAVYTHFDHAGRNNLGQYSLVIGAAVRPDTAVPAGMVRVVVPASRRAVFAVDQGRFDLVGAKWQEIWTRNELPKTFIAEYEHYFVSGAIEISIGVEKN